MAKNAIFGRFNLLFLENLTYGKDLCSARKIHSETPGAILFAKPMQGCVINVLLLLGLNLSTDKNGAFSFHNFFPFKFCL